VKLIVGLGNPGPKYAGTRHNLGFCVVDEIARRWNLELTREKFHAWFADGQIRDHKVVLLKPTTYVNRSGQAVLAAGRFYRLELEALLVVTDDVALPLGKMRMRQKGSAGGHNGLADIIQRLGTSDFCRLRMGVGQSRGNLVGHVLGAFAEDEMPEVNRMIKRGADAVEQWITEGAAKAMNWINTAPDEDEDNRTGQSAE